MAGTTITAIETHYGGCRFRSRLEARWAVFFDSLGIPWQYEPQGFAIHGRSYLPDFRIEVPGATWVEVKGDQERLDLDLLADFVEVSREANSLLILGPVPRIGALALPTHPMLYEAFDIRGVFPIGRDKIARRAFLAIESCVASPDDRAAILEMIHEQGRSRIGMTNAFFAYGSGPFLSAAVMPSFPQWPLGDACPLDGIAMPILGHPRIEAAYTAARSARFEHGERG